MKDRFMPLMLSVSLLMTSGGLAYAANVHTVTGTKGPPDQTIGSAQTGNVVPGNANSAIKSKGSPFGATAFSATRYAGAQPQNTKMTGPTASHLVASQYDVAGFQQSHK